MEFDPNALFDMSATDDLLRENIMAFLGKKGTGRDLVILIMRNKKPGIAQHVSRLLELMSECVHYESEKRTEDLTCQKEH